MAGHDGLPERLMQDSVNGISSGVFCGSERRLSREVSVVASWEG